MFTRATFEAQMCHSICYVSLFHTDILESDCNIGIYSELSESFQLMCRRLEFHTVRIVSTILCNMTCQDRKSVV